MLQIRLSNKGSASEGTGGGKSLPVETVTVACPDHLILADLPVAKSIGTTSTASLVKIVGRRSRRHLGERVHFCVRCDFPIAIYGRLSPCEHAFCLDCARSDSSCYLCDERIQKIQTIKMMEGIFVCAAPHCLKSFLKRSDFESHIHENHADLLQPNTMKEDGNESDAFLVTRASSTDALAKQSTAAPDTSTARNQPRTGFSPSSNSQTPKPSIIQPKPLLPFNGRQPEVQSENNPTPVFDRRGGPYSRFPNQPNFDMQGSPLPRRDSDQQQGILSEFPVPLFPPPNFKGPTPPVYSIPIFHPDSFYNAHYETTTGGQDMPSESGPPEQGSLLGFPPALAGGTNFSDSYSLPWNMGAGGGMVFEQRGSYANQSATYFQGADYARVSPFQVSTGGSDNKDQKGILAPPPPPPPRQFREGQSYGWQHEKHHGYGGSQE